MSSTYWHDHKLRFLRWIAYTKSFDIELKHVAGKDNVVADAISLATFNSSRIIVQSWVVAMTTSNENQFDESEYETEMITIGRYLQSALNGTPSLLVQKNVKKKALNFILMDGILLRKPKNQLDNPRRVVDLKRRQYELLQEIHDSSWAGHRGAWPTYLKLKERYYWKNMSRDIEEYVRICEKCQMHSSKVVRESLHPTYPPRIHFKWSIDIVFMPPGDWGMKYLVLAREDLTNFVEGRALRNKKCEGVCRFILEEIFSRYGCVFSITEDRGELNADEAKHFF